MTTIAAEGVWKFYGDYPALRDITFEAPAGSCLALLGRNGAGKTTLLRILAGLSSAAKGKVLLDGRDPRDGEARARLGYLGHGIGVYDELTARENLAVFAGLYSVNGPAGAVSDWLERTNLATVADRPVREFSRGMRQRLALARTFLHQPAVLLLDEPFTSLDDRAIALLQQLLREALGRGATVVLSTHQLREAMEMATHVALVQRGKLAHFGVRTEEMLEDAGLLYRVWGE